MFKFLMFTAALVSVVPTLGCQPRVVFLSFDAADVGGDVDHLWVEGIMPVKTRKELSGLQVIGYYGVSPSAQQITVRVTACWGGDLLADYQRGQDVVGDDVTIKIQPFIDTNLSRPPPCPMGLGRMGTGGASGGAGGNGAGGAGGAGGDTEGGAGGSAAGGAGGTDIGGASGADGGVTDSAECGTDTHAPTCDPPSGDPGVGDIPDAGTISPDCIQYCGDMRTKCGAVYDSDDSCQRYCAAAGWAPTGISANSLECRTMYLSTAEPTNSNCSNASPGGGASRCGFPCPNFCAAWISICHPDASEASACVTACQTQASATAGADPACRFQWLQRALYDKRYCDYVKYGSCLSCD